MVHQTLPKPKSKITVPQRVHPIIRLIFSEMKRQAMTYAEISWRSGLQVCTLKSWRGASTPSLVSAEAALGALGWRLVPCPPLEQLPADVRERLDDIGLSFRSDDEALAAMIAATLAPLPEPGTKEKPAPLLDYGRCPEPGRRKFKRQMELAA